MIERNITPVLRRLASLYPVITLTGPRRFALEDRFNAGESGELCFCRDSGGCVVYGGEGNQSRSDWPVFSWRCLEAGPPV